MNIVHIAAELSPIAKVGGLAEAVFGLLHASGKKGNLSVILPYYSCIDKNKIQSLKLKCSLPVAVGKSPKTAKIYQGKINAFTVILIKEDSYFRKKNIYGYKDDPSRFLFLSKAALEYLTSTKAKIDILHIHDWHTSATLPLCQEIYLGKGLQIKKTVLSIHNLCYQGIVKKRDLSLFGIKKALPSLKGENVLQYNLLKGGIIMADKVIAVSPTYAKEILQKENSFNLYRTLSKYKNKVIGLLNGIDTSVWNPKTDSFIPENFSNRMSFKRIEGAKEKNKTVLFKQFGIKQTKAPLISYVGRLTEQKGLKLIEEAITLAKKGKYSFILLGSSNEPIVKKHFEKIKKDTEKEKNIHIHLGFDEKLAHQIYAASDFIIIPSVFEPCGLVQLISFHYATIPIARKTGGLKDTICHNKTGLLFTEYSKAAFNRAVNTAIKQYGKKKHEKMVLEAFAQNYCWSVRITDYLNIYRKLLKK